MIDQMRMERAFFTELLESYSSDARAASRIYRLCILLGMDGMDGMDEMDTPSTPLSSQFQEYNASMRPNAFVPGITPGSI